MMGHRRRIVIPSSWWCISKFSGGRKDFSLVLLVPEEERKLKNSPANVVSELRQTTGESLVKIARSAGWSRSTQSRIESGDRGVSLKQLDSFSGAIGQEPASVALKVISSYYSITRQSLEQLLQETEDNVLKLMQEYNPPSKSSTPWASGSCLKDIQSIVNVSLREITRRLQWSDTSFSAVSRYFNDLNGISIDMLQQLAQGLGVDPKIAAIYILMGHYHLSLDEVLEEIDALEKG